MYSYILAPEGLFNGDLVKTCRYNFLYTKKFLLGYCLFLKYTPYNAIFYNLEVRYNQGGKYSRSAGTYCNILRCDGDKNMHFIKLPTGKIIKVSSFCVVSLGRASNI
jgi:ribosomal protein L2